MSSIQDLSITLSQGENLTHEQCSIAAHALTASDVANEDKKTFLSNLSDKGEHFTEIQAFAEIFRGMASDPKAEALSEHAIDVCGTGGDGSESFNISTFVAMMLAAEGIPVFKHGNRSITSKCGSADILAAIGIDIQASSGKMRDSLDALNFAFFFAPSYHPAFKEIMPVRKLLAEEGKRSIFNILGPLINPGKPKQQLLGVYAESRVTQIADSLHAMGLKRGLVVHSRLPEGKGVDELTCAGQNIVAGLGDLKEERGEWSPDDFGLKTCSMAELKGGDINENVKIMNSLLSSSATEGLTNTVLLNAGAGFWISGKASNCEEGIELARKTLKDNTVSKWLSRVEAFWK